MKPRIVVIGVGVAGGNAVSNMIAAGLGDAAIAAVRDGETPADLPEEQALIIRLASQVLGEHRIGADVFDAAIGRWGTKGVIDLVATVGFYSAVAVVLNGFEIRPTA